jgi:CheY-like chemotaxis protein
MPQNSSPSVVRRILLVEDDLDQAYFVKFLLEDDGRYVVTHAQDGIRGTQLVTDRRWDLVITDLNLPGVGGLSVLEASLSTHPETPVLAVTGYTGPEYAQNALEKGATHVLIKPLQRDELLAKVDALISPPAEPSESGLAGPPEPAAAGTGTPRRVLAVGLRPGDVEAGCAATLIRHRDLGDRVIVLTLTHGSPGEEGRRRSDDAKRAGREMGVRFFVGNAGSGGTPLDDDLRRLVTGAINELKPEIVYCPTPHHVNPGFAAVHDAVMEEGRRVDTIFAYDPGDASPQFRPGFFVPAGSALDEKLAVLGAFDAADGGYLDPELASVSAKFWARYAEDEAAEALELLRGRAPAGLLDR